MRRRRFGEWPRARELSRTSSTIPGENGGGGGDENGPPVEPIETFYALAEDGARATASDGARAVWRT